MVAIVYKSSTFLSFLDPARIISTPNPCVYHFSRLLAVDKGPWTCSWWWTYTLVKQGFLCCWDSRFIVPSGRNPARFWSPGIGLRHYELTGGSGCSSSRAVSLSGCQSCGDRFLNHGWPRMENGLSPTMSPWVFESGLQTATDTIFVKDRENPETILIGHSMP